jgi:hypothetical protein
MKRHADAQTNSASDTTIGDTHVFPFRAPLEGQMMNLKTQFIAWVALAVFTTLACALNVPADKRGELLYSTHCVTCQTAQMHWLKDRKAIDWDSLKLQVRRWRGNAGLTW